MITINSFDHVALLVQDIDRSIQWYADLFGMQRRFQDVWTGKRDPVVMVVGNVQLALFQTEGPLPAHHKNEHFAVSMTRNQFAQARQELAARNIPTQFSDHKICHSLYLFDPEGNQIELTTFEID